MEYVASCFISYNHADAVLAVAIAAALRERGYYVWIDQGQIKIGDSLIQSIGDAIDQVDFLIALVSAGSVHSNWCRKELALAMTGEISRQGITVLPCRVGDVLMPPSLADKLYVDVAPERPVDAAAELDHHMRLHLSPADPMPVRRRKPKARSEATASPRAESHIDSVFDPRLPVRMLGVDQGGVTLPRNDGTRGSGLYRIPIDIAPTPDYQWSELFVQHFDQPSQWTTMHRPGIASISGSQIVLDGTTMEELERYHLSTLKLAVDAANADRKQAAEREEADRRTAQEAAELQRAANSDIANRLTFD